MARSEKFREYQREYAARRRAEHPEISRESHAKYYAANRESIIAAAKARRKPGREWASKLKTNFKITERVYTDMLSAQGGRCANQGCRAEVPGGHGVHFHVDHDHACCPQKGRSCGKCIRGLLCSMCNIGIGLMRESTVVIAGALDYLRPRTFEAGASMGLL